VLTFRDLVDRMETQYVWVDTPVALEDLMARIHAEPLVAIDTESNSMHAYYEKVCLIQLSVPGLDALIDPFALELAELGNVLADPRIEKVFHGADYDLLCLRRGFGFEVRNLFDTVTAARLLGWKNYGLAALLTERFGHSADKRFQRYDWAQRPLSVEALAYARYDTHFLLALRELLLAELAADARDDEFRHACQRQCDVEPRVKTFDPTDFWRIKGARELDPAGQSVLHALFVWRERLAQTLDRPVYRVLPDGALVALARVKPGAREDLLGLRGLPRPLLARHGRELVAVVQEGRQGVAPPPSKGPVRLPRAVNDRLERLREWRRAVASERGIEADLVVSKRALLAVAEANPSESSELERIAELDAWERERYGTAILASIRVAPPPAEQKPRDPS